MSKIKNQDIPSELYTLYKDTNKLPMLTGFNYYDTLYGYVPIYTIGKKPPKIAQENARGLGWNLTSMRAYYRFCFQLIGYFWGLLQHNVGVEPPYTGPRSKDWWTDERPEGWTSNYTYYTKQSMFYLEKKFYPPWDIDPNIYISDNGINRIYKINCNTGLGILSVGDGGDSSFDFTSTGSISTDKNYIFVCDTSKKTIEQFDKNTFTHINTFTKYANNTIDFINIKGIFSDGHYLYICDTSCNYLIKQSITDDNDYLLIQLKRIGNDLTPACESVFCSANFIYIYDSNNKYVYIYDKKTNLFIDRKKYTFSKCFFSVSLYQWWIADCNTKLITSYTDGTFEEGTTVGVGGAYPFAFNTINGFCISGDLFLVLDNTDKKLYQINIQDFELITTIDITGRFTDIKQMISEPQQYFYFD